MFFMMGITDGRKDFDFTQTIVCSICGCYGRYEVFMTYTVLSLFFIPCFKWNKEYFVRSTCCNSVYSLDLEVGKKIARGEAVTIKDDDLTLIQRGRGTSGAFGGYRNPFKSCSCGYSTEEDFEYCPKCGRRFG